MEIINIKKNNLRILTSEEPLFCVSDLCKILDIKNCSQSIKFLPKEWIYKKSIKTNGGYQSLLTITYNGLKHLLYRCRKANCLDIIEELTIKIQCYKTNENNHILIPYKEANFIGIISKAFQKNNPKINFPIGDYFVDLYFPKEKIAVECDENGHISYKNDIKREDFIRQTLSCSFIRFNPDEIGFNIGNVISLIIEKIY